jgi:hypothetical protein
MALDFSFSPEHESVRETVRRFCQDEVAPLVRLLKVVCGGRGLCVFYAFKRGLFKPSRWLPNRREPTEGGILFLYKSTRPIQHPH